MKNNYILCYNLNGWCPVSRKLSYEQKIRNFAGYVQEVYGEPTVIMLQEVLAGRNQKFLNLIRTLFSGYEAITPVFDYDTHWKSLLCITLIRKDAIQAYAVKEFDSELPNRINYVVADIDGEEYHYINTHIVQTVNFRNQAAWFIEDRKRMHEQQWDLLITEAKKNRESNLIIGGDLQEATSGNHITELVEAGYSVLPTHHATVKNAFFGTNDHIDQIIFSPNACSKMKPVAVFVDNNQVGVWSDHALIYAACS